LNLEREILFHMYRKPHRFSTRACNPMFDTFGDRHIVALFKLQQVVAFKFQSSAAAHDNHPLIPVLIVPKARRAPVRMRDDTLYLSGRIFKKSQKIFAIYSLCKLRENISSAARHAGRLQASAPDCRHVDDSSFAQRRWILQRMDYGVDHLLHSHKT
jgi:hypothetical protein